MAMKTSAQKAAEKAMWERIAAALPNDVEVQDLCASMLLKYVPTEAEVFAYNLYDSMRGVANAGDYKTAKEWSLECGVAASDSRRVSAALRRLAGDGKIRKQEADQESKVCKYCLV